jgi:hypothetical protein
MRSRPAFERRTRVDGGAGAGGLERAAIAMSKLDWTTASGRYLVLRRNTNVPLHVPPITLYVP